MKSNSYGGGSAPPTITAPEIHLKEWELKTIEAVGNVISFWGFKENHGRIWTYLYLKDRAIHVSELRISLGLSKGAASMLLNDLESWHIILRVKDDTSRKRLYRANSHFMQMISKVFQTRESGLILKTINELSGAEKMAIREGTDEATLGRLRKMKRLAELMRHVLRFVSYTSHLDIHQIFSLLPLPMGGKR